MRAALSSSESIEVVFRCHFGMDCVLRRNDASLDEHDVIRLEQVVTFPFHSHISFALEPFQAARYGVAIRIQVVSPFCFGEGNNRLERVLVFSVLLDRGEHFRFKRRLTEDLHLVYL